MKGYYELNYDDPSRTGPTTSTRTLGSFRSVLLEVETRKEPSDRWKELVTVQRAYKRDAEKGRKAGVVRVTIWTSSKGWIRENLEVHEEDEIKEKK